MPKFQVDVKSVEYAYVTIKAKDSEDAKQKVQTLIKEHNFTFPNKHQWFSLVDEISGVSEAE